MIVGVPCEIKTEENRVALTPSGVGAFVAHGHTVLVEKGAGEGSSLPDALYGDAGARLVDADTVWADAELVLKVKEPQPSEYPKLRPGMILFTYLHLAAAPDLTRALQKANVRALAYETLQLADRSLPLLAPMSEVAGRLSVQAGAWCLQAQHGGRGVLISGASGVRPRTSSSSARASRGRTRARSRWASVPACRSWTSIRGSSATCTTCSAGT
jgi:alanine dehydrogenase